MSSGKTWQYVAAPKHATPAKRQSVCSKQASEAEVLDWKKSVPWRTEKRRPSPSFNARGNPKAKAAAPKAEVPAPKAGGKDIPEIRRICFVRAGDDLDVDFTVGATREQRWDYYTKVEKALCEYRDISFRSSGNSMHPYIKSSVLCQYIPIGYPEHVHEGEVVFCKVMET